VNKKIKFKKFLIFILAVMISFFVIVLWFGKTEIVEVYIVKKAGIDTKIPIGEQKDEYLKLEKVLKEDLDKFGGTVLLKDELIQFEKKRLKVTLEPGSPLLKALFIEEESVGPFAANLPKYQTLYKLNSANQLPVGVVEGDKIDIIIDIQQDGVKETGVVLRRVPIYKIDETGTYISVTQEENLKLKYAEGIGMFILQLPGQLEVEECTSEQLQKRREENIACYSPSDMNLEVNSDQVLEEILNGGIGSSVRAKNPAPPKKES
jgi:hypothetical protein